METLRKEAGHEEILSDLLYGLGRRDWQSMCPAVCECVRLVVAYD